CRGRRPRPGIRERADAAGSGRGDPSRWPRCAPDPREPCGYGRPRPALRQEVWAQAVRRGCKSPGASPCWTRMDVEARYCASHGGIRRRFPLAGGDINVVERWELADGTTCVRKKPRTPITGIYDAERESLNELAKGPLRVPVVFEVGPNWILMEDLGDGEPRVNLWAELGRGLAYLHQVTNDRFGFD